MVRKNKDKEEDQTQIVQDPQPMKEPTPKANQPTEAAKPAVEENQPKTEAAKPAVEEQLSPIVEKAMKLNPHMKSMWITSRGFVHQANAPEYLRKDAKFYVNKYFK